ncbi:helix-turn-helix transcriptional regulator [Streptomyces luteireticuli]|uniref:Helix-turn-helix transcriptional regulator n=1 Tax=Streptomyces luteireticuli TaxID=173858 RepID=A0ABN0Y760_9ACTN
MDVEHALRDFLVSRRTQLSPGDVGLQPHGPRRVAGLRREEVAALASVSVDHYIRLERGHGSLVSDMVLESVADALRLNASERIYLRNLARPTAAPQRDARTQDGVRQSIQDFIDSLRVPAYVIGRNGVILAWNRMAAVVFLDFAEVPRPRRSLGWLFFNDPRVRRLYDDWESKSRQAVGYLRSEWGKRPDDPLLGRHVRELSQGSAEFRRMWHEHSVRECTSDTYRMFCSATGRVLELTGESLRLTDDADEVVVVSTAAKGSSSAEALKEVALRLETQEALYG